MKSLSMAEAWAVVALVFQRGCRVRARTTGVHVYAKVTVRRKSWGQHIRVANVRALGICGVIHCLREANIISSHTERRMLAEIEAALAIAQPEGKSGYLFKCTYAAVALREQFAFRMYWHYSDAPIEEIKGIEVEPWTP